MIEQIFELHMKPNYWFILCLCFLLPIESIAASDSHCAKIAEALSSHKMATLATHDHCLHADSQHQLQDQTVVNDSAVKKPHNLQSGCNFCKVHSVNLLVITSNLTESNELVSQVVSHFLDAETLRPFITLPYKPPQVFIV